MQGVEARLLVSLPRWPSRCHLRAFKLKLTRTLPSRFSLSRCLPCGFRHTCACELASIARMPDPYDCSRLHTLARPTRLRSGRKWHLRLFAQVHQGEFPCHPPSPRLALIPPLLACYPVKGSLRRFAPLTAQAFAAPLRCDGGSGGNDNSRGFIQVQNNLVSVIGFG